MFETGQECSNSPPRPARHRKKTRNFYPALHQQAANTQISCTGLPKLYFKILNKNYPLYAEDTVEKSSYLIDYDDIGHILEALFVTAEGERGGEELGGGRGGRD